MTEEQQKKIQVRGTPLTQSELDAIAKFEYQDLVQASEDFDKKNPKFQGLLKCRQLPS